MPGKLPLDTVFRQDRLLAVANLRVQTLEAELREARKERQRAAELRQQFEEVALEKIDQLKEVRKNRERLREALNDARVIARVEPHENRRRQMDEMVAAALKPAADFWEVCNVSWMHDPLRGKCSCILEKGHDGEHRTGDGFRSKATGLEPEGEEARE
jgi:hypothetical protein